MIPGHAYSLDDNGDLVDKTPDGWGEFECPACGSKEREYFHPNDYTCTVKCVYCKREVTVSFSKGFLRMFGESITDSWDRENK